MSLLPRQKNASAPSAHFLNKLVDVLRAPLVSLYSVCTQPALELAAAVLYTLLNTFIGSCISSDGTKDNDRQAGWERVANSLLSGVLVSPCAFVTDTSEVSLCLLLLLKDFIEADDAGAASLCYLTSTSLTQGLVATTKEAIADALYPVICQFFFKESQIRHLIGASLQCSVRGI
jgi:hypothetical protein